MYQHPHVKIGMAFMNFETLGFLWLEGLCFFWVQL